MRGHKTDVVDSVWFAHLLRQGMVRVRLKKAEIEEAIEGHHFSNHHWFLSSQSLEHMRFMKSQNESLDL